MQLVHPCTGFDHAGDKMIELLLVGILQLFECLVILQCAQCRSQLYAGEKAYTVVERQLQHLARAVGRGRCQWHLARVQEVGLLVRQLHTVPFFSVKPTIFSAPNSSPRASGCEHEVWSVIDCSVPTPFWIRKLDSEWSSSRPVAVKRTSSPTFRP